MIAQVDSKIKRSLQRAENGPHSKAISEEITAALNQNQTANNSGSTVPEMNPLQQENAHEKID